jgi:hypothetical protein
LIHRLGDEGTPERSTKDGVMTYWTRTFHNPFTKQSFEVTSDEKNLPALRARIVRELGKDPEWENESIYVHQPGLDHSSEGLHPNIVLKEVSEQ